MKTLSTTKVRSEIYTIVDEIISTGNPVAIKRDGQLVIMQLDKKKKKLDNLEPHEIVNYPQDDIVNFKAWNIDTEWHEEENIKGKK